MRKEFVFHNEHTNYSIGNYHFQNDKCEQGSYKYYIRYLESNGFRPLHIIIKKIKLYTNHMNVLADNEELHWSTFFFDQNVTKQWAHVFGLIFHADSENQVHFALVHQVLLLQIYAYYS